MNPSVATFTERRDESRLAGRSAARMEAPRAIFQQSGPIVIEEVSACGLRLRSEAQLHPDEELVLHLKGEPLPIHATVVWVREGTPARFGGNKTWLAGCRLQADSISKIRLEPELRYGPWMGLGRKLFLAAGLVGLATLLVYGYLRFASIIGTLWE